MSKGLSDEAIRVAEDVWTEDEPTQAEYELTQRILDVIDVAAREAAARQAGREEVVARVEALAVKYAKCSAQGIPQTLRALVAEFRAPDATSEARP